MRARGLPKRRQVETFLGPQEERPLEEGVRGQKAGMGIYKLISRFALCLQKFRSIPA